jgi:membrane-bound lytic murein transglycosylase B
MRVYARSFSPLRIRRNLRQQPSPCAIVLRLFVFLFCALPFAIGLSSCSQAPQVQNDQSMRNTSPAYNDAGQYHADYITGDFAGYTSLEQFIDKMVQKHGFEREYLMGLFSQAHRQNWTLSYLAKSDQTLAGKPAAGGWDRYRAKFLDERHITAGVAFAKRHRSALQRATREYGVPEEYILGILGVETSFGSFVGKQRILDSLTTLGFDYARRGEYFRSELEKFLLMSRKEGLDPGKPVGSFAGAMGLCQFMPSSYLQWAVDFKGDGHRDLWDPEDAIGSIANYFVQHGWQPGQPVTTPLYAEGSVALEPGIETKYTLTDLEQAGLRPAAPCKTEGPFRLLQLRYKTYDQYLIGYPNFYAITRYNHSTYYAMAVHELGQAIERRLQSEGTDADDISSR